MELCFYALYTFMSWCFYAGLIILSLWKYIRTNTATKWRFLVLQCVTDKFAGKVTQRRNLVAYESQYKHRSRISSGTRSLDPVYVRIHIDTEPAEGRGFPTLCMSVLYLFTYLLFNDTISNSHFTTLNYRIISEWWLGRMGKEAVVVYFKVLSRKCLEEQRKTTKNLSGWTSPGRYLNSGPPE
jgi:hypothetical protein